MLNVIHNAYSSTPLALRSAAMPCEAAPSLVERRDAALCDAQRRQPCRSSPCPA